MSQYSRDIEYPLLVLTITLIPVQIICVSLRLLMRYKSPLPFGLDDFTVALTLPFLLAWYGVIISGVYFRRHAFLIVHMSPTDLSYIITDNKYRLAQTLLYLINAHLPKISILFLYRRLFSLTVISTLSGVLICFMIVSFVVQTILLFLMCRPFAGSFNPTIPGTTCFDIKAVYTFGNLPNIATDLIMLVLPMPVVWSLRTTIGAKIQLTFTFAVGSLGLACSICRFLYTLLGGLNYLSMIFSLIEPSVYLVCACIITFKPLVDSISRMCKQWKCNTMLWLRQRRAPKNERREDWIALE